MKLIAFSHNETTCFGAVDQSSELAINIAAVRKLRGSIFPAPLSLQQLIEQGDEGLEETRQDVAWIDENGPQENATLPLADVKLLAPTGIPIKLMCFSVYKGHLDNAFSAILKDRFGKLGPLIKASGLIKVPANLIREAVYYKGNNASISGPDDEILWPSTTKRLDYEMELAVILKGEGLNVDARDAMKHVFGYTVFNDFSARDLMTKEIMRRRGPLKGKDFATSNAIGPWVVTADEVPDPYNLKATVSVNGVVKGTANTSQMSHDIAAQIAEASRHETIIPGEVIATGCMPNGCGFESLEFLKPGDLVKVEIEGIGVLSNRISQQSC